MKGFFGKKGEVFRVQDTKYLISSCTESNFRGSYTSVDINMYIGLVSNN